MFVSITALFSALTPEEIEMNEKMGIPIQDKYYTKTIKVELEDVGVYYDVKADVIIDDEEVQLDGVQVYTPSMEFTSPMSEGDFSEMLLGATEIQKQFIKWMDENK